MKIEPGRQLKCEFAYVLKVVKVSAELYERWKKNTGHLLKLRQKYNSVKMFHIKNRSTSLAEYWAG